MTEFLILAKNQFYQSNFTDISIFSEFLNFLPKFRFLLSKVWIFTEISIFYSGIKKNQSLVSYLPCKLYFKLRNRTPIKRGLSPDSYRDVPTQQAPTRPKTASKKTKPTGSSPSIDHWINQYQSWSDQDQKIALKKLIDLAAPNNVRYMREGKPVKNYTKFRLIGNPSYRQLRRIVA